eukprot:357320-Chlamydomonas_euryale.AAC.1
MHPLPHLHPLKRHPPVGCLIVPFVPNDFRGEVLRCAAGGVGLAAASDLLHEAKVGNPAIDLRYAAFKRQYAARIQASGTERKPAGGAGTHLAAEGKLPVRHAETHPPHATQPLPAEWIRRIQPSHTPLQVLQAVGQGD